MASNRRLNFRRIHDEATEIRRKPHFLALSFLFFFPITFSFLSALTTVSLQSLPTATTFVPVPDTRIKTPSAQIAHHVFVILFITAGQATITYSTHSHLYRKSLSLFSTLKTLAHSFLRVLLNAMITGSPAASLIASIGFILYTGTASVNYIPALLLVMDFQSDCRLAAPIIVLEPQRGVFQSSTRSRHLLTVEMLYGAGRKPYLLDIFSANMVLMGYVFLILFCEFAAPRFILVVVAYLCPLVSFWWAMQLCYYVVANTILYVHCKVLKGEDQPEMTTNGIMEFFHADVGAVLEQNFRNLAD